jgi:hypothetical protein
MIIEIEFCEIFQNDVSMEEEHLLETSQWNVSLYTKLNTILESGKQSVNQKLQVLQA